MNEVNLSGAMLVIYAVAKENDVMVEIVINSDPRPDIQVYFSTKDNKHHYCYISIEDLQHLNCDGFRLQLINAITELKEFAKKTQPIMKER